MTDSDQPSDRLRERVEESRTKLWFMLEADRWLVAGAVLAAVFFPLLSAGYLYPAAEASIRTSSPVSLVFQGFLLATITGVTLVLTLNQLVLSQELGAAGDQRERMTGAMEFRDDVADAVQAPVSPARPAQFLRALVQVAGERAADLATAEDSADEQLADDITDLTDSLIENADSVSANLDDATFGEFDVISAGLNFNYSWKLFIARRIKAEHGETLDDDETEALDRLIEVLELFGPAREHFKTLYFRWELVNLSRTILVSAIPALVVSAAMAMFFNEATYSATVLGVETLVLVLVVATAVSVFPFAILIAYVLRIATVAKHTLSVGPFILRETDKVEEVEWNR
jgi:hypothetical protein